MLSRILNCFYPGRCPICDRTIPYNRIICLECNPNAGIVKGQICCKCGKPMNNEDEIYCYDCRKAPKQFERGFATFEYSYICDSLYRFKYSKRAEYARFYARKTAELYGDVLKGLGIEALIPVPIHKSRMRKRGYNQALEYARELSELIGIPVREDLLIRSKKTRAQKELTPSDRQKNLKKAFKLRVFGVKLQRVCVVDDIYTTGSTVNAVTKLLKQAGIKEVYFVTIAIGQGF